MEGWKIGRVDEMEHSHPIFHSSIHLWNLRFAPDSEFRLFYDTARCRHGAFATH
jgi:hypothetical protein